MPKPSSLTRLREHCAPLVVVDVEATCCDSDSFPKNEMEIIEIGAVIVDEAGQPGDGFQAFVRPVRHPQLTPFCMRLTGIRQQDISDAPPFPEAARQFETWLTGSAGSPCLWASWGRFDRVQFERDCTFHGAPMPLPQRHVNLRDAWSEAFGVERPDFLQALAKAGTAFEGQQHRGLDDARNIAKLVSALRSAARSQ